MNKGVGVSGDLDRLSLPIRVLSISNNETYTSLSGYILMLGAHEREMLLVDVATNLNDMLAFWTEWSTGIIRGGLRKQGLPTSNCVLNIAITEELTIPPKNAFQLGTYAR